MHYKLLIALNVVEFIERLPRTVRIGLRAGILEIEKNLIGIADATDYDSESRLVHLMIVGDYALVY